jgi:hypothetical protein
MATYRSYNYSHAHAHAHAHGHAHVHTARDACLFTTTHLGQVALHPAATRPVLGSEATQPLEQRVATRGDEAWRHHLPRQPVTAAVKGGSVHIARRDRVRVRVH